MDKYEKNRGRSRSTVKREKRLGRKGADHVLKLLRSLFALIVIALAAISLITGRSMEMMAYTQFFLGALLLAMGLSELQEKRKGMAWFLFLVSALTLIQSIFAFI